MSHAERITAGAVPDSQTRDGLAIETVSLTKRFGRQTVVNEVNLRVPRGAVYGFLGPNGSGKTTTIRMLLGLAGATSGNVRVLGENMPNRLQQVLPRVGALVEGPAFYPFLSGAANLHRLDTADRFASGRTRTTRVAEALDRVGLSHAAGKKVHAYSLGMKQRLGLANALLLPRDLMVLDEPTNGLDPQGTREVRSLVRSLAAGGATVFVSSHLLAEIEQMCTHAAVMSAGSLVAAGTLDELRQVGQAYVRLRTPDVDLARGVMLRLGMAPTAPGDPGHPSAEDLASAGAWTVSAPLVDRGVTPDDIVVRLVAANVRVRGFIVDEASLEDRFVALTGEGFDVVQ